MRSVNTNRIAGLLAGARLGDRDAFSEIVRIMMNPIIALTYKMTQDRDSALDLAQDTFVAAWENLSEFKDEAKLESWLYRIAANKAINHLKRESRNVGDRGIDRRLAPADPERDFEKKELRYRVLSF
ncbi:MAG: sigma-70 family RNA polymerase sigma factor, partial [Candidatus Zixiibacteriota bacterium]